MNVNIIFGIIGIIFGIIGIISLILSLINNDRNNVNECFISMKEINDEYDLSRTTDEKSKYFADLRKVIFRYNNKIIVKFPYFKSKKYKEKLNYINNNISYINNYLEHWVWKDRLEEVLNDSKIYYLSNEEKLQTTTYDKIDLKKSYIGKNKIIIHYKFNMYPSDTIYRSSAALIKQSYILYGLDETPINHILNIMDKSGKMSLSTSILLYHEFPINLNIAIMNCVHLEKNEIKFQYIQPHILCS